MTTSTESAIVRVVSGVAGHAIAIAFAAIKVVRKPRPIHPRGEVFDGQIEWVASSSTVSGIAWIDTPPASGRQDVTVRVSRSVGLAPPLPDVIGLAFRVAADDAHADVELATSWLGVPGRFLLRPRLSPKGTFSSLMPYKGDFGPVVIAARTPGSQGGQWDVELLHATSTSKWRRFATMHINSEPLPDRTDLRFDPVLNPPPGAGTYPWARRLRQRSYAMARKT